MELKGDEIWKDIQNYEGLYRISNYGNLMSLDRVINRNNNLYNRKSKILKKSVDSTGYEIIGLTKDSKTKSYKVHRLVGIHFIDNNNDKPCINHKDGNKLNNHIDNLEWSTYSENTKHAIINKLSNPKFPVLKGESNGNSLLTQEQVNEIREKYIPFKYSVKKLSLEYNVSESCIYHIINNTSWKENVK